MLKSYKYKLNPTDDQKILLNKHFGCIRFVYNHFLEECKTEYATNKKSLTYNINAAVLVQLKHSGEYSWLNETNAQSLQYSLKCLDGAYNNFFSRRADFPKFKCKDRKNTFTVPQFVKVNGNVLSIPKFREGIKMIVDRKFDGEIRSCTLSRTCTNEYFVSILVNTIHVALPNTGKTVALDLGLKDFAVTSDGVRYKNNRYTKKYARKLKEAQQHLSRKTKGSNRYNLQKLKVAKIYKKITNSRKDNLHKVSTDLITKYDTIFIEDLAVKEMMQDRSVSKSIADASWYTFTQMLTYKANWNEKQVVKVDRYYPSSKTCNNCGYINQGLNRNDRVWTCPHCGSILDRDFNAAKNILGEGIRKISSGTDDYRRGDQIRPVSTGTIDETSKFSDLFSLEANMHLAN